MSKDSFIEREQYKKLLVPKSANELVIKTAMDDAKNQLYQEEDMRKFTILKAYSERYKNRTILIGHIPFIFNDKGECEIENKGDNKSFYEILLKNYQVFDKPIPESVVTYPIEETVIISPEIYIASPVVAETLPVEVTKTVETKKTYFKNKGIK